MSAVDQSPWTAEQIDTIRAEWAAGASAAEIGKLIGRPKGSVTGKARRMGLPARPSPIIRRAGQQDAPLAVRLGKAPPDSVDLAHPHQRPEISGAGTVTTPVRPERSCEWIDGQRGAYVKCGATISRGSYCAEHAARCYVGQRVDENAS